MTLVAELCARVSPVIGESAAETVRRHSRFVPPGSLGKAEAAVVRIWQVIGGPPIGGHTVILGADHGIAVRGVSAAPQAMTALIAERILAGRAPVNYMARDAHIPVSFFDLGMVRPVGDPIYRVSSGTSDISIAPAMSRSQAEQAIINGAAAAASAVQDGQLVALGEIGVANTSSASALAAALLGTRRPVQSLVGPGTGISGEALERKRCLVGEALSRNRAGSDDIVGLISSLGGFEIAGVIGAIIEIASRMSVAVIDGYITTVAAACAIRLCPPARDYVILSHRSAEPGYDAIAALIGEAPLLDLGMRLGMASGAVLACSTLLHTAAVYRGDMPELDKRL